MMMVMMSRNFTVRASGAVGPVQYRYSLEFQVDSGEIIKRGEKC